MTERYGEPPANLRSLRDRLTHVAKLHGVVFGRLQQHVAVLVVTQFMSALTDKHAEPLLLVKGGASLELRRGIPASRTSKDLDVVSRADANTVHDQIVDIGHAGWEGFTATFTPPDAFDIPGLPIQAHRFTAKLNYRSKPFASVPIEISPAEAGNAERYDTATSDAFTLVGLPPSDVVPCMTLPWQIAQKLHACTGTAIGPHTNDRAHDLVDLQLLEALTIDEPVCGIRLACRAVFSARQKHAWPPAVVPQPHWGPIYQRALEGLDGLGLAPTVGTAAQRVQSFVARIEER